MERFVTLTMDRETLELLVKAMQHYDVLISDDEGEDEDELLYAKQVFNVTGQLTEVAVKGAWDCEIDANVVWEEV